MKKTFALIGAGNIGGTIAQLVLERGLGDVLLFDKNLGLAKGKALDLSQAYAGSAHAGSVSAAESYADLAGADAVIITAGLARKPGMTREELLAINADVMADIARGLADACPNVLTIVVTNPLDAMVWVFLKASGFDPNRVIGMASILDTWRFKFFLAELLGVNSADIHSHVIGAHGATMVPLISHTSVQGTPLMAWLKNTDPSKIERLKALVGRTRNAGAEIVEHLKRGSAYFAPANGALAMAQACLNDEKMVVSGSVMLNGEYGAHDICMSVPLVLGKNGVERIVQLALPEDEQAALLTSIKATAALINPLK